MPRSRTGRPLGRPLQHPWREWFAELARGGEVRLRPGADGFAVDMTPRDVQQRVLARARVEQVLVRTRVTPSGIVVVRGVKQRKHPWAKLLDGRQHVLIPHRDYDDDGEEFIKRLKEAAAERGVKVRYAKLYNTIYVQALDPLPLDSEPQEVSDAARPTPEA